MMLFMSDARPDETGRPGAVTGEELLPLVYDELRRLAAARLVPGQAGLTLQPTALVHEAWIRLSRHFDRAWQDREHFFNAAALTMRRILVDRARKRASAKHHAPDPGDHTFFDNPSEVPLDERLLLVDESLKRLEVEDPAIARIVMLKYFGGLTNQEIAETVGINLRTVVRKWTYARIRLFEIFREIEGAR
jgi:RNA polymerase sigma factor (TIGR02999 family)